MTVQAWGLCLAMCECVKLKSSQNVSDPSTMIKAVTFQSRREARKHFLTLEKQPHILSMAENLIGLSDRCFSVLAGLSLIKTIRSDTEANL